MSLYGLIIGLCLVLGIWYFQKNNKVIPKDKEDFFSVGTVVFALIGARAYHVIDQWNYYSQDLIQILNTRGGGLGIYGGLIGGVIFITLYSWIYKTNLISVLDTIAPILPLAQAIGRIGNYFNHENPIWWQEAFLNLILFFAINTKALKRYSSTALYLIGYGIIRLITEFYRSDTWVINGIKTAHIISTLFILLGIVLVMFNYNKKSQQ